MIFYFLSEASWVSIHPLPSHFKSLLKVLACCFSKTDTSGDLSCFEHVLSTFPTNYANHNIISLILQIRKWTENKELIKFMKY